TLLENGANQVGRVYFFKRDVAEVKRQAWTKAVENALANCRALAKGAGAKINDTIQIEAQEEYFWGGQGGPGRARLEEDATTLVPGEFLITCRVNLVCSY